VVQNCPGRNAEALNAAGIVKVEVSRKAHFNAAHRLYRPDWDAEKNEAVFGKCNNPNFHGHNYEVIAHVEGDIDPETGYVIDLKLLKHYIQEEVVLPFDHKNLNLDVEEFKVLNPTAEHIVTVIWNRLRKRLDDRFDLRVTLYETDRNYVEYRGE
jgi:6-pyruvoyltetrahydropterin/6-carboxytetrahydropterin synthase